MKCLVINGSSTKGGNTELLTKIFVQNLVQNNVDCQLIHLSEYGNKLCQQCNSCKRSTKCILKDDVESEIIKVKDVDTIIFATPVYWGGISGNLKCFIDRLNLDSEIYKTIRYGVALVNSEYCESFGMVKQHFELIFKYMQLENLGILGVWGISQQKDIRTQQNIRKIGEFVQSLIINESAKNKYIEANSHAKT